MVELLHLLENSLCSDGLIRLQKAPVPNFFEELTRHKTQVNYFLSVVRKAIRYKKKHVAQKAAT